MMYMMQLLRDQFRMHIYQPLPQMKSRFTCGSSNIVCTDVGVYRSILFDFPCFRDAPAAFKPTHSIANPDRDCQPLESYKVDN